MKASERISKLVVYYLSLKSGTDLELFKSFRSVSLSIFYKKFHIGSTIMELNVKAESRSFQEHVKIFDPSNTQMSICNLITKLTLFSNRFHSFMYGGLYVDWHQVATISDRTVTFPSENPRTIKTQFIFSFRIQSIIINYPSIFTQFILASTESASKLRSWRWFNLD